jgi:hypothetical protein
MCATTSSLIDAWVAHATTTTTAAATAAAAAAFSSNRQPEATEALSKYVGETLLHLLETAGIKGKVKSGIIKCTVSCHRLGQAVRHAARVWRRQSSLCAEFEVVELLLPLTLAAA